MPGNRIFRVTLSGTYRRDLTGLRKAYDELATCGCQILSPHRLDFTSDKELFVKDRSETHLDAKVIEQHHMTAIGQSDFVWLHAPDGYIGLSAAMEIGYAVAQRVPVFCRSTISEPTLAMFVTTTPSVYDALVLLDSDTTPSRR